MRIYATKRTVYPCPERLSIIMKLTVEKISPVQKKMTIEIEPEKVSDKFNEAIRYLKQNVSIKGFRKGKAPRAVLEREYGPQIKNEVMEKLVQENLPKAIEEADVIMLLEPALDTVSELVDGNTFTFSVLMDIAPEFDLPEYKGIKVEKPMTTVNEEEVEEQFNQLLKHFAEINTLEEERPVKNKDLIIIDYEAYHNGSLIEDLSHEDYYLEVGTGTLGEEFDENLVGIEKDKPFTFEISYPDDAINTKVAGKTISYKVVLKEIKERKLPEKNEEFFSKLGQDLKTEEDVKNKLRLQIEEDKKESADGIVRQQIIDALLKDMDFPIPERIIEKKLDQMVDNIAGHMQERGVDLERAGVNETRLRERMRNDAISQVRTEFILDKISDDAGIDIPASELQQYSDYVDSHYESMNVQRDQLASAVMQNVLPKLRASKTLDFLVEQAEINVVDSATLQDDES